MNKYNAKKTEINGIKFDSKKEANYYLYLQELEDKGEIYNLELQKKYILLESFECEGKKIRPIIYIADFDYDDKNNKHHTIDVKGRILPVFKLKQKLFMYRYRYNIDVV